jgi:hypothetical protein
MVNGSRIATPGFVVDLFIRIRQFTFRLNAYIVRGFGRDVLRSQPFLACNNATVKEVGLSELRFPILKATYLYLTCQRTSSTTVVSKHFTWRGISIVG